MVSKHPQFHFKNLTQIPPRLHLIRQTKSPGSNLCMKSVVWRVAPGEYATYLWKMHMSCSTILNKHGVGMRVERARWMPRIEDELREGDIVGDVRQSPRGRYKIDDLLAHRLLRVGRGSVLGGRRSVNVSLCAKDRRHENQGPSLFAVRVTP